MVLDEPDSNEERVYRVGDSVIFVRFQVRTGHSPNSRAHPRRGLLHAVASRQDQPRMRQGSSINKHARTHMHRHPHTYIHTRTSFSLG